MQKRWGAKNATNLTEEEVPPPASENKYETL